MRHSFWLKNAMEFSRFIGSGAISFALTIFLVTTLPLLGLSAEIAYGIALGVAMLFNFVFNRRFVFVAIHGNLRQQATAYLMASAIFRCSEWLMFAILANVTQQPPAVIAFMVQGVSACVKYLVYKRQIFRTG